MWDVKVYFLDVLTLLKSVLIKNVIFTYEMSNFQAYLLKKTL